MVSELVYCENNEPMKQLACSEKRANIDFKHTWCFNPL